MKNGQEYPPSDAAYGKKQPTVGQIHDVRFRTNGIARNFERKSIGGWEERHHELLETLPFYVTADIGGEKIVVRGSVKYAATPAGPNRFSAAVGTDSSASRADVISHGKSYNGRHVRLRNPHEIPDIIYGSFSSKSTCVYEIRTIID